MHDLLLPGNGFLIIPFIGLLLMIAAGPVLFEAFWHKYYKAVSVSTGLLVGLVYLLVFRETVLVAETFAEYISFIALLLGLYVAAGGIYIYAHFESKATVNIAFLLAGAVAANLIGTTGASVLLIRPFIRINKYRLKPYHIVFFIFFVSNLGGALTPIGDPPLFMGFLKGIPFNWTLLNTWPQWLLAMGSLCIVFWFFERSNRQLDDVDISDHYRNKLIIAGRKNFIWLGLMIVSVFIDPNVISGVPAIHLHGKEVSFVREIIQLFIAFAAYRTSSVNVLKKNKFGFEPIKEVAYLFFGIFIAMIPALKLLEASGSGLHLSPSAIFWGTGIFSAVLDNAPTFLNFLALSLSMDGLSISDPGHVRQFLAGEGAMYVKAISVGAVFFGAMTYIGNGPNFMVKAIAESYGVKMPGFFRYIFRYSLPVLLPLFVLLWLCFFRGV